MNELTEQNKMASAPVKRMLITMGIPVILSMMLQAVYNIVDSAFVSSIKDCGEAALNALTLAFPVQMLMVAIGIGTGVGANALLSKSLGQGDYEKAGKVAGNAIFLGGVIYAVFLLFGIFGVDVYVATQTDNEQISEMASVYLRICCVASMGCMFFSIFEKLLQATGRALFSTISQIAGAVVNIVFDPIFIFGYFGFPEMGVSGAAWATVLGQIVSLVLALVFHLKFNREVKNGLNYIKPSATMIKEIYAIGLPAIIAQALMSIMTYGLNLILVKVSESAVTAYGLYYKMQQFILFIAFGLRDVITPVVSFNHGMKSKLRVTLGVKYGIIYTEILMAVGLVLMEIFAVPLAKIFGLSGETEVMCISAMRIISLSFLFAGANVALQGVFQALDSGVESLVISLLRQFVIIIPVAWGFSLLARESHDKIWCVWLSFLIAEGVSLLVACLFMARVNKRKIRVLN